MSQPLHLGRRTMNSDEVNLHIPVLEPEGTKFPSGSGCILETRMWTVDGVGRRKLECDGLKLPASISRPVAQKPAGSQRRQKSPPLFGSHLDISRMYLDFRRLEAEESEVPSFFLLLEEGMSWTYDCWMVRRQSGDEDGDLAARNGFCGACRVHSGGKIAGPIDNVRPPPGGGKKVPGVSATVVGKQEEVVTSS
ncbi:hypothetical protein CVT26_002545 [Gymnopilus dilepis]|uniref:Uncharacterized protein n=1 Tax=Gymnopilus dilepis TaxID=231916 RepID=A0A409Y3S5_9AGAR|nr:hypothetical protein CVT26_002545 [Gymnopilus dilepis]